MRGQEGLVGGEQLAFSQLSSTFSLSSRRTNAQLCKVGLGRFANQPLLASLFSHNFVGTFSRCSRVESSSPCSNWVNQCATYFTKCCTYNKMSLQLEDGQSRTVPQKEPLPSKQFCSSAMCLTSLHQRVFLLPQQHWITMQKCCIIWFHCCRDLVLPITNPPIAFVEL
jgi:hypothetical protein